MLSSSLSICIRVSFYLCFLLIILFVPYHPLIVINFRLSRHTRIFYFIFFYCFLIIATQISYLQQAPDCNVLSPGHYYQSLALTPTGNILSSTLCKSATYIILVAKELPINSQFSSYIVTLPWGPKSPEVSTILGTTSAIVGAPNNLMFISNSSYVLKGKIIIQSFSSASDVLTFKICRAWLTPSFP